MPTRRDSDSTDSVEAVLRDLQRAPEHTFERAIRTLLSLFDTARRQQAHIARLEQLLDQHGVPHPPSRCLRCGSFKVTPGVRDDLKRFACADCGFEWSFSIPEN
jgi:hypothetical protein